VAPVRIATVGAVVADERTGRRVRTTAGPDRFSGRRERADHAAP